MSRHPHVTLDLPKADAKWLLVALRDYRHGFFERHELLDRVIDSLEYALTDCRCLESPNLPSPAFDGDDD